ncbi:hypothetical protein ElyMa_000877500 [Elysia marginata]|uniref:Uncharacterized protein n=1 Tax=Elysia marginata TaxID=1093978 RepID=A0AAV4H5A4_9GAST|nr:hypothetical protein ElyMa_000877500 [Elysia marginata]
MPKRKRGSSFGHYTPDMKRKRSRLQLNGETSHSHSHGETSQKTISIAAQCPWFDSAGDRTTYLLISERVSYRKATEPVSNTASTEEVSSQVICIGCPRKENTELTPLLEARVVPVSHVADELVAVHDHWAQGKRRASARCMSAGDAGTIWLSSAINAHGDGGVTGKDDVVLVATATERVVDTEEVINEGWQQVKFGPERQLAGRQWLTLT